MKRTIKRSGKFCVYIVKCADGTYYTGYTNDLEKRIGEHNKGKRGAKYTRGRWPVELVWVKEFRSKSDALKMEAQLKKMSRKDKEKCITMSGL